MIIDKLSTILIEPDCHAIVTDDMNIGIELQQLILFIQLVGKE